MRVVKLSVIVPFYNVQTYAPDTLRSLRANARDDFEFLLVDDRSTDGTAEILQRARKDIPGAKVIVHERNGGLATARNTGLDAADGEYLTFLDGDDWLAPGYFADLVAAAERLECDFVRTDHVQATGRTRTVHRVPHGLRNVALSPRSVILPVDRTTSVDYPYAWWHLPPPPARPGAAALHRRAAHRRGPAVDLAAAPGGGELRRGRPARPLLPARGRLLAHPDR